MGGGERGARRGQRVKANSNMDGGREGARGCGRGREEGERGARGGQKVRRLLDSIGGRKGARGGGRGREGGERHN